MTGPSECYLCVRNKVSPMYRYAHSFREVVNREFSIFLSESIVYRNLGSGNRRRHNRINHRIRFDADFLFLLPGSIANLIAACGSNPKRFHWAKVSSRGCEPV